MVYVIQVCCVYSEKLLDDGQRNCPKHVEFYSKNKFEKLVHLVGSVIRSLFINLLSYFCVAFLFHMSLLLLDSFCFLCPFLNLLPSLCILCTRQQNCYQYHTSITFEEGLIILEVVGLRNRRRRSWTPGSVRVELLLAAKYRGIQRAKRTMLFFVTCCKLFIFSDFSVDHCWQVNDLSRASFQNKMAVLLV